jgi:ornithine--oxo-acid transaminase
MAAISLSCDPESRDNYGPYLPNIGCRIPGTDKPITYNDCDALRLAFEKAGPNLAAFLVEPIQGEAGIVVPSDDYLREARALCDRYHVLLICDEIQTGIARTGKLLCYEWSGIKPDLLLLGKALSGGMYPVSCVLGPRDVMLTVEPGTHGSTYGGNPLGSAVAIRALEIIRDEHLVERAERLGHIFRDGLRDLRSPAIKLVRGRGLLNAIVVDETKTAGHSAWDLCMLMKEKGLLVRVTVSFFSFSMSRLLSLLCFLRKWSKEETIGNVLLTMSCVSSVLFQAKPTHQHIIRLAPPLVITEDEIRSALKIIGEALAELPGLQGEHEDEIIPPSEKKIKIGVEN